MNESKSDMTDGHETLQWRRTGAPLASSRTDDIWFLDADRGWLVNSNGHILQTRDGGDTWKQQYSSEGAYLRCIGFADETRGWVGTLDSDRRLLQTDDGGTTWTVVESLPDIPRAICGLSVLSESVIFGSGSNFPDERAGVIKSLDGGQTWDGIAMGAHASLLVDIYFRDEMHGWVVGGKGDLERTDRDAVRAVVLATEDGGQTWHDRLESIANELPLGEWGWKIQFVNEQVGFVSLENFTDGAILKTVDGGQTWTRKAINDPQDNANLEGIGFVDDQHGWAGGWGNRAFTGGFTSETRDGGDTWSDANHVGKFLNRFRFIREPELVGYAAGDTVYKFAAGPPEAARERVQPPEDEQQGYVRVSLPLQIPVTVPEGADSLRVDVWDRFGRHLATPMQEPRPAAGVREVVWSGETTAGGRAEPGVYIYRVTIDETAESSTLLVQ